VTAAVRRIVPALAVLAALGGGPPARAGLPDWAEEIADKAPAVPEGSPEFPWRTLFEEVRITVAPDGTVWRRSARRAVQFLSNRVDSTQFGFLTFNGDVKVKRAKGWHLAAGERAKRNYGGALDVAVSDTFLTDAKQRAIALEDVRKASLVFYEFETEEKPYSLTESFEFGDPGAPVDLERVTIELPPRWDMRHAWLRADDLAPVKSGTTWTWERTAFVPPKDEKLGPDASERTSRLVVTLLPPEGQSSAPVLRNWDDFARWYTGLAKGRDAADPAIEKAARAAFDGAGPEPIDKIRAGALLVRDRVRYVDRAFGIGGITPRAAAATFSEANGDCKDKGTLFRSVLAVGGFRSYPILINATASGTVAESVPDSGAFDHFIVGVEWPKDQPVPAAVAPATVDVEGIGKILVVDTTDEYCWPGTIPSILAGHRGVMVVDGRGLLVTMPAGDSSHRVEKSAAVTVREDGSAAVRLEVAYFGSPAEEARVASRSSSVDRRKSAEDEVRAAWAGAEVKSYSAVLERADGAYVETISFEIAAGSPELGEAGMPLFAGATVDLPRVPVSRRTTPVVFPYPLALRYDTKIEGATAAIAVPSAEDKSGKGWTVHTSFGREGEALHGTWSLDLSRTRFEPDAFPDAKQMWSAASLTAGARVAVHR
jgi:hypothetical protein